MSPSTNTGPVSSSHPPHYKEFWEKLAQQSTGSYNFAESLYTGTGVGWTPWCIDPSGLFKVDFHDTVHSPRETLTEDDSPVRRFSAAFMGVIDLTRSTDENLLWQRCIVDSLFVRWLSEAKTHEEILAVLRLHGIAESANRLSYLYHISKDDPNETQIEIESLRSLAWFLIGERQLKPPRIGISPEGMVQIEWRAQNSGILAMKFLSNGQIQFAGITGGVAEGTERDRISGICRTEDMMQALRPFISKLGSV